MHIDELPPASIKEFTILMALLMSIVAISIDAFLPALGVVATDLQLVNANHAQYLITCIFLGMSLGQLVCGPLSDALGRKKVLYWSIGLYLVGSALCLYSSDFNAMLLGRFIQGLGVSGPYVSAMSIVRDKYSGNHMARILSIVMMIFIMVPAIAPSLGQAILFYASWRSIFLMYMVYAVIVGLWLFLRLEETLPKEKRIPFTFSNVAHGFKEVVFHRATLSYTICMGLCFGSFIGYLNSSQQIFQVQFGVGKLFTVYFGVLALVFGASSLFNARLVEKLGMRYLCMRALYTVILASIIFMILCMVLPVTLWMFLSYIAVLFFCFGLLVGNLNALAMEPMGHIAGMASAIIGSVSSILSTILGTVIGQFYNGTLIPLTGSFLVLGLIALCALVYGRTAKITA